MALATGAGVDVGLGLGVGVGTGVGVGVTEALGAGVAVLLDAPAEHPASSANTASLSPFRVLRCCIPITATSLPRNIY